MSDIISYGDVEKKIIEIRGEKVLLDRDVAELYGVETKRVNEAVKNNLDKFPDGYTITLSKDVKYELVENFDRFDMLKHSSATPTAFTEKGLYMLATILKSPTATQTTIAIVETFAKLRELNSIIEHLPDTQDENQQKALAQRSGELVAAIFDIDTYNAISDEISVEFDLPLLKVKRTVKREKRKVADGESSV